MELNRADSSSGVRLAPSPSLAAYTMPPRFISGKKPSEVLSASAFSPEKAATVASSVS